MERLAYDFFSRDVLEVAPGLLGKTLVRCFPDGRTLQIAITETEAYRGEEDLACHASKGRTGRTQIMYLNGGHIYIYLIYGMYWMLNFVAGKKDIPQAALIRGVSGITGPGKLTKYLGIDKSFNGESLTNSQRLYVLDNPQIIRYKTAPRIGIDYAGKLWASKPWRFILEQENSQFSNQAYSLPVN